MTTDPTTYDLTGPPDAPALVFLHAASYTRKMWLPQTHALQNEFRVLALDLPAHGAWADTPFTFAASVQAIADAMDGGGITPRPTRRCITGWLRCRPVRRRAS